MHQVWWREGQNTVAVATGTSQDLFESGGNEQITDLLSYTTASLHTYLSGCPLRD